MRRLLLIVAALLGGGLLLAGPASAHATVVTSSPADGARLTAVPHTVTITFDENVGLGAIGYLHVTDGSGKRVDAKAAYHPGGDGTKVADDLVSGLKDGSYTASFRVISADSHPVAGTIAFVVGKGALVRGAAAGGGSAADGTTSAVFDAARWLGYAGLAVLGGAWLLLTVWPIGRDLVRARRIVWAGWGAAALGAALELWLQGPYTAGDSLAGLADPTLLDATLHTNYGQLHSVRLLLLGVVAVLFARSLREYAQPRRWEVVYAALLVGIAVTISAGGHAATTSPAWLSIAIDVVHLLSMSVWLGGLLVLVSAVLPRREPDELTAVLPVFSRVAFVAVVLLAGSGTYSAFRGIGTVDAVLTTAYGLLIVAKVALFLAIIAVAQLSRRLVQRRLGLGGLPVAYAMTDTVLAAPPVPPPPVVDPVSTERLRRAVFVEALVGLVVLALTAVLVNQPRGKEALVASYRHPVSATAPLGSGRTVTVTSDPGVHGAVEVTVALAGGATASSITASATETGKQIGPLPVRLTKVDGDRFDGRVTLPVAGRWRFDLVVTSSALDAVTTDVVLTLH